MLTNQASATADQFDPVLANNTAQAGSAVGDAADLRVTKTVDRPTADVGDVVTWTITASNLGPRPATGVSLTDVIPAGVVLQSVTTTGGHLHRHRADQLRPRRARRRREPDDHGRRAPPDGRRGQLAQRPGDDHRQ